MRWLWLVLLCGCVPDLEDRASLVTGPRILAVRATPAESSAGDAVQFDALAVDPDGALADTSTLDWAFCNDPVPLDQIEPVSARCLTPTAAWLAPIGDGTPVTGTIPADVCRTFGPTPADAPAGQPAARPVDPDATGGYYQPIRILAPSLAATSTSDYVTFRARVDCGTVGLTQAQAAELAERTHPNVNPVLDALSIAGATLDPDVAFSVAAGASTSLHVAWASCPDESACTGAEQYATYDPSSQTIVTATEHLQVSWFATDGRFAEERSTGGVGADDTWVAPTTPGLVRVWIVVRDDRGGVGFSSYQLSISTP